MKKNLIILSSILLSLVVYLYIFEVKIPEKETLKREKNTKILSIAKNLIDKLEVKNSYGKITLKKDGKNWLLTKINKQADKNNMQNILDELSKTYNEDLQSKNLENFGINNKSLSLLINNKIKLVFGFKTPVGPNRYIYNHDSKKLFTINNALYSYLNKNLNEFRDKAISTCNTENLEKIEYKNKNLKITFIKDNIQNSWSTKEIIENNKKDTVNYTISDDFYTFKNLLCSLLASDYTDKKHIKRVNTEVKFFFKDKSFRLFKLKSIKEKKLLEYNNEVFILSDYDYNTLSKTKDKLLDKKEKKD